MAGWLPALALIAASLRFEVTRSFQSFISRPPPPYFMPVMTLSKQQPHHPSLPELLFARQSSFAFLRARTASARSTASVLSIPRCQEGMCQHPGGQLHPVGFFSSGHCSGQGRTSSILPATPRHKKPTKKTTLRPACRRLVPRHSPLQNNL